MFERLLPILLGGAVAALLLHFLLTRRHRPRPEPGEAQLHRLGPVGRLLWLAIGSSLVVLAATGFGPALYPKTSLAHDLVGGERLGGWLLLVHCAAGLALAAAVLIGTVSWFRYLRFTTEDGTWWRRGGWWRPAPERPAGRFDPLEKVGLILLAGLTLVALITPLLSMVPLADTEGLELLVEIHRWSALALALNGLLMAYRGLILKPGAWQLLRTGRVARSWALHHHPLWAKDKA